MDFLETIKNILIPFIENNIYIAILVGALLIFLLFRKPKLFLAICLLALLLTGVLYLISSLSSTGTHQKQRLIQKEELYREH
ncbi:MAG: hypothetical protein FJ241_12535 [Nitrospira sp.]|nr:hypothetical protein [Nitrospira sp.]